MHSAFSDRDRRNNFEVSAQNRVCSRIGVPEVHEEFLVSTVRVESREMLPSNSASWTWHDRPIVMKFRPQPCQGRRQAKLPIHPKIFAQHHFHTQLDHAALPKPKGKDIWPSWSACQFRARVNRLKQGMSAPRHLVQETVLSAR